MSETFPRRWMTGQFASGHGLYVLLDSQPPQRETRQTLQVTGKLIVRSTGQVHGNALYGELEVERGGVLRGAIKPMRGAAATSAPAPVSPVEAGASEVAVDAAVSVPTN